MLVSRLLLKAQRSIDLRLLHRLDLSIREQDQSFLTESSRLVGDDRIGLRTNLSSQVDVVSGTAIRGFPILVGNIGNVVVRRESVLMRSGILHQHSSET